MNKRQILWLVLFILMMSTFVLCLQLATKDGPFSDVWRWNPAKSDTRLPVPKAIRIDLDGKEIQVREESLNENSPRAQNPNPIQDVKLDVGGYRLQFHIVQGTSPTIVFEAGGGDDSSAWRDIVPAVARKTGARMITYDRAGFGQSDVNPGPYSITQEVEALERGLKQLQINRNLILVAHSYGGFLATLFAARNTSMVRGVVLIDASLAPVYTDIVVAGMTKQSPQQLKQLGKENPQRAAGLAKLMDVLPETVRTMRNVTMPTNLRVTDIVAEKPAMPPPDDAAWIRVHQDFDRQSLNRRGVIATGSGHNVMRDRPELVTDEIVDMFQRGQ